MGIRKDGKDSGVLEKFGYQHKPEQRRMCRTLRHCIFGIQTTHVR